MNDLREITWRESESVTPAGYRLDGAPDDYWQNYADDVGPFAFPIQSAFITKRLTTPPAPLVLFQRGILSAFGWLVPFGYLAIDFGSLPLLLVAAAGFGSRMIAAWSHLLGFNPIKRIFTFKIKTHNTTQLVSEAIAAD